MSKKRRKKIPSEKVTGAKSSPLTKPEFRSTLSNIQLIGIMFGLALVFGMLSYTSTGMYQGEEGVHYMNMKEFWYNPNKILGNWAKPGWKLIYVVPAILGYQFLHFFNGLISAAAGIMAYKLLELKKSQIPWLAIVLLGSQFLWIQMSFRNYSELVASLLVVSAIYFHEKNKYLWSSLLVSYLLIIRQEWLPFAGLYGLLLLYKRAFLPAFLIALFPILVNIWGWIVTDDPLYYYTNAVKTSEGYGERYPRHGFLHYFKVSLPIFGPLVILGITAYFTSLINKKYKPDYLMIIPVVGFFLLMCILNIKDPKIGTSTAGNWRYLLVITPLLSVLASMGWIRMSKSKEKLKYWLSIGVVGLLIISFSAFKHNYIVLSEERHAVMVLSVLITMGLAVLPLSLKNKSYAILALAIGFNLFYFKPKIIEGENKAIKELIPWLEEQKIEDQPIIHVNAMVNFFWDKTAQEYKNGYFRLSEENVKQAPVGSYIFWESHYSVRFGKLDYKYFQEKPDKFKLVRQVISDDKRFMMLIYQKIA